MSNIGIVFSSVTWFEKQAERTKTRVKRDDLDTLSEVFTGPSAYEDNFVPAVGSVHPSYNLMTVISTSVHRLEASVSEITVNYQGKLDNSGATGYTSIPTISKSWMEGEVTYQVNGSAGYSQAPLPGSGYGVLSVVQLGIVSFSRRYTGRCVELAYITNRVPTGEPTQIGFAKAFLGFQNIWDTMSGFSAGMTLSGGGGTVEQMACTNVRVEDRADGWYRVTETYQSRMFPGPVGYQFPPPSASAPAPAGNIASDTSGGGNQVTTAATSGGENTVAAVQAIVDQFSASSLGSVGANTATQTGMDPAWGAGGDSHAGQMYTSAGEAGTVMSDSSATQGYASPNYDG